MRLDYTLYALAVVFFVITVVSFVALVDTQTRSLSVVATVVLGLLSIGLGYNLRPKIRAPPSSTATPVAQTSMPEAAPVSSTTTPIAQTTMPEATTTQTSTETPTETKTAETAIITTPEEKKFEITTQPTPPTEIQPVPTQPSIETAIPTASTIELMQIKGIKEKRATYLKTIGINSINDLAKASAQEIAKKLQISPKTVEKWITDAKKLAK